MRRVGEGVGGGLARRLGGVPEGEREGLVLELVVAETAVVLGHGSVGAVREERAFKELGLDSLAALELRSRLAALTGLALPATLVFDHPTPASLAKHLLDELSGGRIEVTGPSPSSLTLTSEEPIAIVGMSCRYPGAVRSPEQLWELLASGIDAIGPFPTDRGWDLEHISRPGSMPSATGPPTEGGFVYDAGEFDADFFHISPREALAMDPQQRLLLETAWEALEDAGIDPTSLRGGQTGVFAGVGHHEYGAGRWSLQEGLDSYWMTGSAPSAVSGRVAYALGLEGPAVSVDTACSSALVALHLACQALRAGECSLALACGVSVMYTPALFVDSSRNQAGAPDGRCKSFADAANGTNWGEGAGVVLIERLTDAQRLGHEVLALVRGSAVNQDGASNGLTAPNGPSQQRVISKALASARLTADQVDAVEAHGTGTRLGDPIEAQALLATYGRERPVERPLWLGSIKSNIGHTGPAAGVAGVIKMVMAMRQGLLPRTLHVDRPTRNVDWSSGAVSLLTEAVPWPRAQEPRRAGVSSFGVSGTNAHVILEEAPGATLAPLNGVGVNGGDVNGEGVNGEDVNGEGVNGAALRQAHILGDCRMVPLLLSGKVEGALREHARRLDEHLSSHPHLDVADVGWSLATGRTQFERRAVLVGEREQLHQGLRALGRGESHPGVIEGIAAGAAGSGVAFLFPGQGAQWRGMALGLMASSPVFAEQMRHCEEALSPFVDWSVLGVLREDDGQPELDCPEVLQPALFAVMVSLAALWRACGVHPAAVVGHSQGEIAAAHVAGGLSLPDAARLIALRSRILTKLVGHGAMASVALPLEELSRRLERSDGQLVVAAMNGPRSFGVAGDADALDQLLLELEADGVRARRIRAATGAGHSPQVEMLREEFLDVCAGIAPSSGDVPFFSTVTGGLLDTAQLDVDYWYRNMRQPVRFLETVRALLEDGFRAFLEISAHPVLTMGVQETADELLAADPHEEPLRGGEHRGRRGSRHEGESDQQHGDGHTARDDEGAHDVLVLGGADDVLVLGSLRRDQGDIERFLCSLGEAWVGGVDVDWAAVFAGAHATRVRLPSYPFQRRHYWLTGSASLALDAAAIGQAPLAHPLLGAALALADGERWLLTGRVSLDTHPWLSDHAAMGVVLLPGAAFVEMALRAGAQVGCQRIAELTLQAPLVLPEQGAVHLQVSIGEPDQAGRRSITIHSRPETPPGGGERQQAEWVSHAVGLLEDARRAAVESAGLAGEPAQAEELAQAGDLSGEFAQAEELAQAPWPPSGAQAVPVDELYDRLAARGYDYGTAFQGLRAAWRRGEDLYAEIVLSEDEVDRAAGYGLHPALLDAALHAAGLGLLGDVLAEGGAPGVDVRLPFAWNGVELYGAGASRLRVKLSSPAADTLSLVAATEDGEPIATVRSLVSRPISPEQLQSMGGEGEESLLSLQWLPIAPERSASTPGDPSRDGNWALICGEGSPLERLPTFNLFHRDLQSLGAAIDQGPQEPPELVLVELALSAEQHRSGVPDGVRAAVQLVLELLQSWLSDPRFAGSRLVLLTRSAIALDGDGRAALSDDHEAACRLIWASAWGLLRSAQSENPDRIVLIDLDGEDVSAELLFAALAAHESQMAVREGVLFSPRLLRGRPEGSLAVPTGTDAWQLDLGGAGTLDSLDLVPAPQALEPLLPTQVRVQVRAAGVNFRDVMVALGLVPVHDPREMGGEGAGVIVEVGAEVRDLAVGDRVMGLLPTAFGPLSVADERQLVRMPAGWSFAQAASVPIVFLTALYGLVDLAGLQAGERLLVHAAAGGVGMAALQLASHLGVEVLATASPGKWDALRALGCAEQQIASSRTPEFRERFMQATAGEGVDVVLNSLARELVDASLDLLPRGGRFVEMGKTDIRDAGEVARERPGVIYRAFDLPEVEPERLAQMLAELADLFERGVLRPLPVTAWDVRRAPDALRFLSQARHIGKVVLTFPPPSAPEGTVLITGGADGLAGLLARHLVAERGVRSLVLASRRGADAPGAPELRAELESLGAQVVLAACDVAERDEVERLLALVPDELPLAGVVHAAGVLDDGVVGSLTAERLDRVLTPKVHGAWHLHELTKDLDLVDFILFSSAAGTFGGPGQGSYAAANVFLDALAAQRRAQGLPAVSMAWGPWAQIGGAADLREGDLARMSRSGLGALSPQQGLDLFDRARLAELPLVLPMRLDTPALRSQVLAGTAPPLLRGLVRAPARRASGGARGGSLARRLQGLSERERQRHVLELVRAETAVVLGHATAEAIGERRAFKELGFDSLAAVELRNRLVSLSGLRLASTAIFDHPSPSALTRHILEQLAGASGALARAAPVVSVDEPIAIVGMSCRYPGGVGSADELWELVAAGGDAISVFPTDRAWNLERLYDADPDRPGRTTAREGGFVYDAGAFDAGFFSASPREAAGMDPQQRLLLEVCWQALEHAGLDPLALQGSQAGVFAGAASNDYHRGGRDASDAFPGHQLTDAFGSVISGRVAYALGLEGPAITVDTACSSSLVALHLACQALRSGECSLALAGGVTVMATPDLFVEFSRQQGLAADGRCKSFAAGADGTGWGEGVGVLVLERLSEARRLGHEVLAVVRGSAVNQDGASNGLTAPNGPSQQRVIAQALANAGLSADRVDVVEGHGTGTTLGDPIEAQALLATYGRERPAERPLWLGSIKSNIGHTQMAAGVAGVIKMVMAMRHGVLPPTLHVDEPSREVDWSSGSVSLLTEALPWPADGRPRRAAVSSFGISGTNAHVILEQEPPLADAPPEQGEVLGLPEQSEALGDGPMAVVAAMPWVLSGRGAGALQAQARRLADFAETNPAVQELDIGLSLAVSRAMLEDRAVVLGEGREELLQGLEGLAAGNPAPAVHRGTADLGGGGVVFLFTGQGAQRVGMGRELYERFPVFREALDEVCESLDGFLQRPLREVLWAAEGSDPAALLDWTMFAQPGLFALEVALDRLLQAWGVRPDYLLGHSIGELAAAHVAGVFSLEDACRLVAARGALMAGLPEGGAMLSVQASEQEARASLAGREEHVALAAVNGPSSVVLSGDEDAVLDLAGIWQEQGRKTKRLRVSHAFHSPRMDDMLGEFQALAAEIAYAPPRIPVVSNVTGELATAQELCTPGYWVRHVRDTVRFFAGVRCVAERGARCFLELGPDGVLSAMTRDCLGEDAGVAAPLLRGERPEARASVEALARVWVRGVDVQWGRVFDARGAKRVRLPSYAFQRERYWRSEHAPAGDVAAVGLDAADHPLLGAALALAGGEEWLFTGRVGIATHPWLADHMVMGTVLLPGTALVEIALRAGSQVGCRELRELALQAPLVLPAQGAVQLQVALGEPDERERRSIEIHSRHEGAGQNELPDESRWVCHASGTLSPGEREFDTGRGERGAGRGELDTGRGERGAGWEAEPRLDWAAADRWPPPGAEPVPIDGFYERLAELGYEYGESFQGLHAVWRRGEEIFAELALPEREAPGAARYGLHPALLDSALHAAGLGLLGDVLNDGGSADAGVRLPFSWGEVRLHAEGATRLRVRLTSPAPDTVSLQAADEQGGPVATVDTLSVRDVPASQLEASVADVAARSLFSLEWTPVAHEASQGAGQVGWAHLRSASDLLSGFLDGEAHEDLLSLGEAIDAGRLTCPDVLFAGCLDGRELAEPEHSEQAAGPTGAVRERLYGVLELLQAWLADERFAGSRLVLLTRGAIDSGSLQRAVDDDPPRVAVDGDRLPGESDLAAACVWGLVRSAQSEHPGRLLLVDLDGEAPSAGALTTALAGEEPQLLIRAGKVLAPRLTRAHAPRESGSVREEAGAQSGYAPDAGAQRWRGTVLITGGTGALGGLIARHLVSEHGVPSVLLASRRGPDAEGALELRTELEALGARVVLATCDVSDRAAVERLLALVPEEHPLGGVVHTAGAIDDGVIGSLTPERIDRVLAAKVDGAWHLHELTRHLDLSAFVLFSSAAATFGAAGQGNYAAGNAFLDALAAQRRAQGLPAISLAWGWWEQAGGMTGHLDTGDRARAQRLGVQPLSSQEGLALFDAAPETDLALVLPARLDTAALRAQARAGTLPALLRGLVRVVARRSAAGVGGSLARRLAGVGEGEREGLVLELVRVEVAGVLGYASGGAVDVGRTFRELGFDSLAAVELRNRLGVVSGLSLSATLVFDYPTPLALAGYLLGEAVGSVPEVSRAVSVVGAVDEPVAIVGMSCRYPGGVRSPRELWELVASGRDGVSEFPLDRGWDADLYDPDPDRLGKSYTREGGFLHDAGDFDAEFFGISPRAALAMDPQQRLLLETAWEAFEDAGIDSASLRGSQTGVFAGLMYHDYGAGSQSVPEDLEGYLGGGVGSIVTGLVAYTFGLQGPAITVDTACSSSLVALHLACQALRSGECSLALAGGVTVMATPGVFIGSSRQRGLAADGRCKSFAAGADGTGWGEGVGVLVLERLSEARRLGHEVLAVVRGSAVNQDGASNGLTAPNGPSQQRVIAQALANAGLSADRVDVVEGHGTGTTLGDPIEAQALLATYGRERPAERPLWLGSIKSNIGHTQAAAGVAGVIKMVMAMRHGLLPPTLHVDEPSREVDWSSGSVSLLTEAQPWQADGQPRRAAVSSFGVSGTNAHVILEQDAEPLAPAADLPSGAGAPARAGVVPWVLCARGRGALHAQAARLGEWALTEPETGELDIGLSLSARAVFGDRAVLLGEDRGRLLSDLETLAGGGGASGAIEGVADLAGGVAFLFTGQGAQRAGMGRELYEAFPPFKSALDEACACLDEHLGRSLRDVMFGVGESAAEGLLDQTLFTQSGLFALEVALFAQVRAWGVRPDFLIGHSIGELAAAHVAGVLSLKDACALVAARGRLMGELPAGGAMVSVQASEEEVRASLAGREERVALAAVNGPASVVLSGDEDAVLDLADVWLREGRKTKRLRVSHAFHSPRMEGMLDEFAHLAAGLSFSPPRIPIVSNLTGAPVGGEEVCTPEYWVRHVRETVRFMDGVSWLREQGVARFLELGPAGVLSAMVHECAGDGVLALPALRGERPEERALLEGLAGLWVRGMDVDWSRAFADSPARCVGLPSYAFQHRRYWLSARAGGIGDVASIGLGAADHPLLSTATELADGEGWLFSGRVGLDTHPWLAEHAVMGVALLPGAALVEIALRAGTEAGCDQLDELALHAPLALPAQGGVQLQVALGESDESGRRRVQIHARPLGAAHDGLLREREWTCHASGTLSTGRAEEPPLDWADPGGWPPPRAQAVAVGDLYEDLAARGYDYGPLFQGLQAAWRDGEEIFAEVALPTEEAAQAAAYGLHPALLDAALHAAGLSSHDAGEATEIRIPFSWSEVRLYAQGASRLRVRLSTPNPETVSVEAVDEDGRLVVSVGSLVSRQISNEQLRGLGEDSGDSLFCMDWVPLGEQPGDAPAIGKWAMVGDLHAFEDLARAGEDVPEVLVLDCRSGGGDSEQVAGEQVAGEQVAGGQVAGAVHEGVKRTVALVESWLAEERLASTRLALLSNGAVAAAPGETVSDLVGAAVWGLLRSAQSEHPNRLLLLDVDGEDGEDQWAGAMAAALAAGEPQVALRGGVLSAPRLVRAHAGGEAGVRWHGTVLITGGSGGLGALIARHLVVEHGVLSLLLASRRGPDAEGALKLQAELESLGAQVILAACDVSDRGEVEHLLALVPQEHPLGGVVHTAGVLDDGVLGSLTADQVDRVLAPKVDGAWHLHELTRHLDLSAFVLFSSAASAFGAAGQGNYAAANAFLDALAVHRRAQGLSGVSLAWGLWDTPGELTGGLREVDLLRLARSGVRALSPEEGLALFDAAGAVGRPLVLPVGLDTATLRAHARAGMAPALLRGLVRVVARRSAAGVGGSLARRLAGVGEGEREGLVLELVRGEVAGVLGYASGGAVDVGRTFRELGFDSLAAVELRNRLGVVSGLSLSATLVFDYPTPLALAGYLLGEAVGSVPEVSRAVSVVGAVDEPVAIVGMSCRYPGGVRSPRQLWELLAAGRDAISGFPTDRGWDIEGLYDPDPDRLGKSYTREGGFLRDVAEFDAEFFGISPREALAMDPQQRLLLEAAWEAFEDAGIDPASLRGSATGVFAGVMSYDYGTGARAGSEGLESYLGTGNIGSVASGRLAYTFGLEGPAMTVDTACSSSLVALHLACQALRSGECSLALAGGVTVMSTPGVFVGFSRQRGLAPDGRCKSYASGADGTGWGEGVGMLLVERLSDARRLGHEVLAVVRGSAVNQDGASNGMTAPNGPSQQRVIAQALANAGLDREQIDAVEGHGTGTALGDPIEAQALLATYGRERPAERPLWLGSIKSNIGHTQAAAGVAGVIKMVMAMRHGVLPPTLHVDEPSREVDWSSGSVSLLTEAQPWPADGQPRRAAVSSFGVSGTNAHVILEQGAEANGAGAPAVIGPGAHAIDGAAASVMNGSGDRAATSAVVPWVLSGRGVDALRAQAGRLREFVGLDSDLDTLDVGLSLADGRAAFERRAVVVGEGREALLGALGALAGGRSASGVLEGVADVAGGVAFLFPGQGSQWVGMAVELLDSSPVFAERLGLCDEVLEPLMGWSVEGVLRGVEGAPGLGGVDVVQPVLFAVMVGLAGLWRACGVQPGVVVGHSQGEIAAAHVAGGLSLEDAARLVVVRSRALVGLMGRGGMVSVALGLGELEEWLERWDGVSVAALNGPSSVVVSGERQALEGLLDELVEGGVRAREIPVGYASHSVQIEEIREELLAGCQGIVPASGDIPFFSTVTGELMDMELLDGEYWYRNLRETVRFEGAVRALLEEGYGAFIEISPHPVLSVGVQETIDEVLPAGGGEVGGARAGVAGGVVVGRPLVVGSLRREQGGLERFLTSLGEAWVRGVNVDWRRVFAGSSAKRVGLPTYAFQRERYWLSPVVGALGDVASAGLGATEHPLLSTSIALADGEGWLFTGRLSLDTHPWLADHALMGTVLLPGTAFVELALRAGREVGCERLGELTLQAPLVLPEQGAVQLQVRVGEPSESGERTVGVYSRPDAPGEALLAVQEEWICHAAGILCSDSGSASAQPSPAWSAADAWPPAGAEAVTTQDLYGRLAERGFEYGPLFQGLRGVWRRGEELFAEVSLPREQQSEAVRFGLHPALLDAALHAVALGLPGASAGAGAPVSANGSGATPEGANGAGAAPEGASGTGATPESARIPFSWSGVTLHAQGASCLRVALRSPAADTLSLVIADERGEPVASVDSLVVREISAEQLEGARSAPQSLFCVQWVSIASPTSAQLPFADWAPLADVLSIAEQQDQSALLPEVLLLDLREAEGARGEVDVADAVHSGVRRVLGLVQGWLADERLGDSRLVVLSSGAVAAAAGEDVPDLVGAAVWGLLRAAQSEHPGRLVLIDVDGEERSIAALGEALATGEPQLAVREGALSAARLVRGGARGGSEASAEDAGLQWRGTVLITGGTGGLGSLVARHLVSGHGVRSLLLSSRRGADAEGASQLQAELRALGAEVRIAACDVAVRGEVEQLLALVPAEHPLGGVVHTAGVLEDGVIESLTAERTDRVLAPKVDGAWHLHELTKDLDLSAFLLFSSATATLGAAGQGNYAAANAFLDALAARRRAQGLPGLSLAWGLWDTPGELTGELREADLARMARSGVRALTAEEGLALFDAAPALGQPLVLPVRLDTMALRARATAAMVPALLRGLVRVPPRRSAGAAGESLERRLAGLSAQERERLVLELVRGEIAVVLGHASGRAIDEQRAFKDLGFDSLAAVELRNRLNFITGLQLPATLLFDYPTPIVLAQYILEQASGGEMSTKLLDAELEKFELALSAIAADETQRARIATRLGSLLSRLGAAEAGEDDLESATDEEIFSLIDEELGAS